MKRKLKINLKQYWDKAVLGTQMVVRAHMLGRCPIANSFELLGVPPFISSRTKVLFTLGKTLELEVLKSLQKVGAELIGVGKTQIVLSKLIAKNLTLRGSPDAIYKGGKLDSTSRLFLPGTPVEVKNLNYYSASKIRGPISLAKSFPHYYSQAITYAWLAKAKCCIYIVKVKDSEEQRIFSVPRDDDVFNHNLGILIEVVKALAKGRLYEQNSCISDHRNFCNYKHLCEFPSALDEKTVRREISALLRKLNSENQDELEDQLYFLLKKSPIKTFYYSKWVVGLDGNELVLRKRG